MIIEKLIPHGFCKGVMFAIKTANEALDKYDLPIYMLGKIIHNDIVCDEFSNKGYIIKTGDKLEELNKINKGTVIFTAHGTSDAIINNAVNKGLNVIDTTCPKVRIIHNKIKDNLSTSKILYVGVENHPECVAALSISKDITLIRDITDLYNLDKDINYYVTNQTTLSLLKLEDIYSYIENNFKNATIDNKICMATTTRQKAVLECTADCIIVVGDKKSSNTNELYNIATSKCTSHLVSDLQELKLINFSNFNNIKLTCGASTPQYIFEEIYNFLINTYL